ncbi:helix-turn-helix domain-containing protein [Cohnella thailandensis]|uniref:AraC family transcriptional regulator n=1 Tax=Cohnella thailandensis TaxID=557557 RepID=A0A841SS22_9BACL|nr:helix-turn-helix domain-containing protein [Cohnella thailandensis]MBB6632998.1 AraC family transcriptional regulator [Cohnella thailandensis]MBP1975307.1 AraC-like DNA-binding protein [Cohnella thailandensis]
MREAKLRTTRGIVQADEGFRNFTLARYEPDPALASLVEHYWLVRWDLRDKPDFHQNILSYPSVQWVFENDWTGTNSWVYGVPHPSYTRHLKGFGESVGVKFRPGGFYPYWRQELAKLTGNRMDCAEALGAEAAALEEGFWELPDDETRARRIERFLLDRLPEKDEQAELANRIVQSVIDDRNALRVEDVADRYGLSVRSLQRLFSRYVGVSPKWVLKRFRLQEAAERLEKGGAMNWAELSQSLGYYDQAHFIKDFKALLGMSPEEYAKKAERQSR